MPSGLLPDAARLILPAGIVSTGFPATEATCRKIGIEFDRWQADLNRCVLAKDADGLYAADTVALSICRQAGKTYDVGGIVFADSIINRATTSVWTAHRFKVARESFNEMRAWAKSPRLRQHIDYDDITTAAGNECIPFRNGSRILFAARERGAIRGFTKVRRLILDEAQILSEQALADLVPTMNQARNPQVILMGTPPKPTDPSDVWTRLRAEALAGESEGVLYVEFSAWPGADPLDREAWRRANPSYPLRTGEKAILRMYKLLSPEDFPREALGIWDAAGTARWLVVKEQVWKARGGADGRPDAPVAFGVGASWPDAAWASIGSAGRLGSERLVQVVDHRPGIRWVVERAVELRKHQPCAFVVDPSGPAGQIVPDLEAAGIEVLKVTAREACHAAGQFLSGLTGEAGSSAEPGLPADIRHYGQDELDRSVADAAKHHIGDVWRFDRRGTSAPVESVALAAYGHAVKGQSQREPMVAFA